MPNKITLHFQQRRQAWSESFLELTQTLLKDSVAAGLKMGKKRLALMGTNVEMFAIVGSSEARPGTVATTGDSLIVDLREENGGKGVIRPADVEATLEDVDLPSDIPNTSLLVRMTDEVGKRRKALYMAGIPDEIVVTKILGPDLTLGKGWFNRFKTWRTEMRNTWGFWARKENGEFSLPQKVIAFQQMTAAPSFWGVVTLATGAAIPVDTKVQLKGFRHVFSARRRWQGFWTVNSVLNVTGPPALRVYFLENSALMDPADVDKRGTIEAVEFEPQPIKEISIVGQATRKRGVGYDPPHGRSKPRRTLPRR